MTKVVLIGAGNMGYHIGHRFKETGFDVIQVFSRTLEKAKALGHQLQCSFINDLEETTDEGHLYVIAVTDRAIASVAAQLSNIISADKLVVHTSGATPSSVLSASFPRFGVFYPLQTFIVGEKADFSIIPLCVHAKEEQDQKWLLVLGRQFCPNVYEINDEQRAILHVAAVFVCNFTNHFYQVGSAILEREQIPFDLLRPLIFETALKVQQNQPEDMQTGPAIRGDQVTIERHLQYLQFSEAWSELYKLLSKSINNKLNL